MKTFLRYVIEIIVITLIAGMLWLPWLADGTDF